ncbi:MAG: DUF4214 domain-containing protein [Actinobacteria bacterium]|nr:DUF4214 domain-containing protein [Actinomycetota bacterium]
MELTKVKYKEGFKIKKTSLVFLLLFFLFFSGFFFFHPSTVFAETSEIIYVDGAVGNDSWSGTSPTYTSGTNEGPKATISAGINAVAEGGTVYVSAGTYYENISINKSLTIIGTGPSNTKINHSGAVIYVKKGTVSINDFTISGGTGEYGFGGGIYNVSSSLSVDNCIIKNNYVTSGGGGIYNTGTMTVTNCVIASNSAGNGGGIYNVSGKMNVRGSAIVLNTAASNGGGISNGSFGVFTISGSTICDNSAPQGDGVQSNNTTTIVNAIKNWWGTGDGPIHSSLNPEGTGNAVSDNVNFIPFLTYDPVSSLTLTAQSNSLAAEDWVSEDLTVIELLNHYGASATGFTKMLYDNILDRVPDESGLNNWTGLLGANQISASQMVYNFVFSGEMNTKISLMSNVDFINFVYQRILLTSSDSKSYDNWLSYINNGYSKEQTLTSILSTSNEEWTNICKMFNVSP